MPVIIGRNATVEHHGELIVGVAPGDPTSSCFVAPGLVDLQVNGVDEIDFGIAHDGLAIADALRRMTRQGTTGCLPTIVTAPLHHYDAMIDRVRQARDLPDADTRCEILGVHLEGPFLGGAPGAHPQHLIRDVDLGWLQGILDQHGDLLRMVTIAPEADPEYKAIRLLTDRGVVVALGHSTCSYDTARAAIDAGARVVTHLYNGMSGLHHRDPGLATAALLDERVTPTLIADLHHVSAPALRVALATRSDIALITDAVAPGAGESGGMHIEARGGAVFLRDGTMAGSIIHMIDAVRNLVNLGFSLDRTTTMATTIPCDVLGRLDIGRLAVGTVANVVEIDIASCELRQVWLRGEAV